MKVGQIFRQSTSWTFGGAAVCTGMLLVLLAAPAGGATDLHHREPLPLPPSPGESSPFPDEPLSPPLILIPATGSADARLEILGQRLVGCGTAHGKITSSRNGVSATAEGEVFVSGNATVPVATVHLDEHFGFSTILQIPESTAPGEHGVVNRCGNTGDNPVSAGVTVPVPPAGAAVPTESPINAIPPVNPILPETTGLPGQLAGSRSTFPGGSDGSGNSSSIAVNPSSRVPTGNTGRTAAAKSAPTGNGLPGSSRPPGSGLTSSWGALAGLLVLTCAGLVAPALGAQAFQNRRGKKWVRTNVRATADAASAPGIQFTPQPDTLWPPTFAVGFAVRGDSGTQVLTEADK